MLNLPTKALENWHFTPLAQAHGQLPTALTPQPIPVTQLEAMLPILSGPQVVFYRGQKIDALCTPLPQGVTLEALGPKVMGHAATAAPDTLDTLAAQAWQLNVTHSQTQPLVIIHIAQGAATPDASLLQIHIAANITLTVLEVHIAPPHAGWHHHATHVELGEQATLTHSVLNIYDSTPHRLATRRQHLAMGNSSTYTGSLLTLGGSMVRSELHTTMASNGSYHLHSLSCPHGTQHHDVTLQTHFTGTGNRTNLRQRNLQDDQSHAVFQGKFYVAQAAQQTDAYMHTHTLLLSDEARTSSKPELEIYADDVKCSHGAACGGLNPAQLFYLKARGLPEATARALLVQAFADEFVSTFPASCQTLVGEYINHWLHKTTPTPPTPTDFSTEWLANTKANPEQREVLREFGDTLERPHYEAKPQS